METSIFLAKFWGWYLIIFFLVLSFNPKRIRQIFEDLKDQKFVIIIAFMAIVIGLLNILFHNTWESDWTVIITLMGWGALLEGLLLLAFPNLIAKWLEYIHIKLVQVLYILMFLVGIFLLNMAYNLVPY
jgi:hypothetical protein